VAKWTPWVGLWYDGVWNDITTDVYERDSIQIRRGKTDEASTPVPTTLALTLKNRDQKYTPGNPTSTLYGKLGRNIPIQVCSAVPVVEDFEDTSFLFTWGFAGTGTWARSSTLAKRGTWSFKSPVLADGQQSSWQIDVPAGQTSVSFWINASIGTTSFASAYTSEGLQWFLQGSTSGWQLVTVDVGTSNYVLINYQRTTTGGTDSVFVDDLRMCDARATCEAYGFVPGSTIDYEKTSPTGAGDAWVQVSAGGLLRRIGQASDVTDSPIKRAVLKASTAPVAYWPMEDPEGVSGAAEAFGNTPLTPVTAVRYTLPDGSILAPGGLPKFQNDGGVPGSDKLVGFVDGGTLAGNVPSMAPGAYGIDTVMRFKPGGDAGGTSDADVFSWRESGTYVHYVVNVIANLVTVFYANAADDAILGFTGSMTAAINVYDGAPHHIRFQVVQSGGNYAMSLYIDGTLWDTETVAGTVGRPTYVEWNPGEDRGDYMPAAAGHVIVWPVGVGQPDTFTPTFGYPGEMARSRLKRFGTEESWATAIRDQAKNTDTLGPQTVATMPQMLADIERTEDGILYDQRGALALALRTRRSQYAQTSRLDLTYGTSPLQPLDPVYDDQGTRNDVTAKNRDGQQYEAEKTTGTLAITSPIDGGVGRYPATIDVNTLGGPLQLTQIAWWWANKGTLEGARHPVIVIDLDANVSLAASVAGIDLGDRITITGLDYDRVDLRVLGVQESFGLYRRLVTLLCEPYRQYDVAIYQTSGATITSAMKRYDSKGSTLNAGYTSSATTMVVTYTDALDDWSTTSVPYDWIVAGERITVTAMGAVTGTGPYTQSATVTRAVNGVSKAQTSGTAVHMHPDQQARYAL
jgi:hypothetical protein